MFNQRFIAVTCGDVNGVGPEIIMKALSKLQVETPIVITCNKNYFLPYSNSLSLDISDWPELHSEREFTGQPISFLKTGIDYIPEPGLTKTISGSICMESINKAIDLCLKGSASAMVTAPISKEAVNLAGYKIPGHTEYLAQKDGKDQFLMALINETFRVVPLTIHVPLSKVSSLITKQLITEKVKLLHTCLVKDFGISKPKIAILGLNPHAGDGGVIGNEEIEVIEPTISLLKSDGINVSGPFPADAFFATGNYKNFDAILSMYHDQGLIPFKMLSYGKGVNTTLGLSFVRTSPDHGTAFDIAGKGIANEGSMLQAIETAINLSQRKLLKLN